MGLFERGFGTGDGGSMRQTSLRAKRKAMPKNELLDPTFKWVVTLPRSVQPLALMRRFPRIVNQLASSWSDTPSVRSYLDALLVDHRGDREGFPREVLRELLMLRLYHEIGVMITVRPTEATSSGTESW
jgi:hypothetical protein